MSTPVMQQIKKQRVIDDQREDLVSKNKLASAAKIKAFDYYTYCTNITLLPCLTPLLLELLISPLLSR